MSYSANSWFSIIPAHYVSRTSGPIFKLNKNDPLAKLHANFWPTIIKDRDEHSGVDDREDTGDDDDIGIDATEDTDDEDKKDESDDGEVGSGCHILNIRIPEIHTKVWVRKEYIRLYDYCNEYVHSQRENMEPLSVVISGQPGIGKTCWVIYALHRCLTEGKPVIWYHNSRQFLFVEEGVFELPEDIPATIFKTRVWTLVDSDESPTGVPPRLAVHYTKHFNIYTSSPPSSRWKPLRKTTQRREVIMNPWSREEISQAAVIHGLTPNDPNIDAMYDQFGPTPRICFEFVKDATLLVKHKEQQKKVLLNLSVGELHDMAWGTSNLTVDSGLYTIFLVKRIPREDLIRANLNTCDGADFCYTSIEPITHAVKVALWNYLSKQSRDDRLALYNQLKNFEGKRHIANLVSETLDQPKPSRRKVPLFWRGLLSYSS